MATVSILWLTAAVPGPYQPPAALNRARLKVGAGVSPGSVTLLGGVEYYALRVTVDYAKSVGYGACSGCATPATIVLNDVWTLNQHFTTPLANACLRWQADGVTPCSATPARNSTWGQVKGLYR